MTTRTKAANGSPIIDADADREHQEAQQARALANVTTGGALVAGSPDAEAAFLGYAQERDEFLGTPFSFNRSLAKSGAAFTVLKCAERQSEPLEGSGRTGLIDQFVYLAQLQEPYMHEDTTTGEVKSFDAGARILISLEKNAIRQNDFNQLKHLCDQHGNVPNLALQEYPSSKAGLANPHGIVHKSQWKTLAAIAKERGLVK